MKKLSSFLIFLLLPFTLFAADAKLKGLLKSVTSVESYQSDSIMDIAGDETAMMEGRVVGRIMLKAPVAENTVLHVHYENNFSKGEYISAVESLKGKTTQYRLLERDYPHDSSQLFSMSQSYIDSNGEEAFHRLDRLYAEYKSFDANIRFGRQALTLGHGKVFNPVDILNPFEPTDIIRDYKNGSDMLSVQSFTKFFEDVHLIAVPRRNQDTQELEADKSSAVVRFQKKIGDADSEYMLGGHYGDAFLSGGFASPAGDAVLRLDTIISKGDEQTYMSAVANIDYSWMTLDNNTYGYIEFYYNNLGVGDVGQLRRGSELYERLERGDIFMRDRFYSAIGFQYEVHPLINVYLSAILNINDSSFVFQPHVEWDIRDNVNIIAGLDLPEGDTESEFGGFYDVSSGKTISPAKRAYAQIALYF